MKKLILILSLALAGCANQAQLAAQHANDVAANERMNRASRESLVKCPDRPTCAKAFALAKVYVMQNADMKVEISNDTMISTYNPPDSVHFIGKIGLTALLIPSTGDSSLIQLRTACLSYYACVEGKTAIWEGFKPFIESRMD